MGRYGAQAVPDITESVLQDAPSLEVPQGKAKMGMFFKRRWWWRVTGERWEDEEGKEDMT